MTSWGLNIGGFMRHHDGWLISGSPNGFGYTAQHRNAAGLPRGPVLSARTLDELAGRIEQSTAGASALPASRGVGAEH